MWKYVLWVLIRILYSCVACLVLNGGTGFSGCRNEENPAKALVDSWCSAYRNADAHKLAATGASMVEIIDRFGSAHHFADAKELESFWSEGFEMVQTENFNPVCVVIRTRFIREDVAIVLVRIVYQEGIRLGNEERIPKFSELHSFVIAKANGNWTISAQVIVEEALSNDAQDKAELALAAASEARSVPTAQWLLLRRGSKSLGARLREQIP